MSCLTLLSVPIGNMGDITLRALEHLKNSTLLLCEDTRNTKKLFQLLDINLEGKQFESFHEHNKERADKLAQDIKNGLMATLVSDAGSPIISDPAYPLVNALLKLGGKVESLPGASSVITALELSGLPPVPFMFHGFFPRDKNKQIELVQNLLKGTHLFFESPQRIKRSLKAIVPLLPNAEFAVGRELTKKFESFTRFKGNEYQSFEEDITEKGEFVLLIHIPEEQPTSMNKKLLELAEACLERPSRKSISKLLANILDKDSKDIYQRIDV